MILVFDCNGIGWAAAFTNKDLSYRGKPTGVIHGFLKRVLSLYEEFTPKQIVFCWDSEKSQRRRIFPGYKDRVGELTEEEREHRKGVREQFRTLRTDILPGMGFANVHHQIGYEADDLIASVVLSCNPGPYMMISEDADMYQLLERADMYLPRKGEVMTAKLFEEQYGIPASKWSWVKQIAGCSTDTVPGIPGVGEKKAIQYIRGEMAMSGKIYQRIISPESLELTKRNAQLVTLPLAGTKQIKMMPNKWNDISFLEVCTAYGLRDIEKRQQQWEAMFYALD